MASTIDQGIVIKKHNYDDYDMVVTILTATDKLSFLAREVRKIESKNRYALQLSNLIEVEIFKAKLNNKLSKLKKAITIKEFNLNTVHLSSTMLTILKIINNTKYPQTYFYETFLKSFDYFDHYSEHIKTYFKFLNLKQHGINPVMNRCYQCLSYENIIHFSWEEGGFICDQDTRNQTSLIKLKAYQLLGKDFSLYIKVNNKINLIIEQEIDYYEQKTLY